MQNFEQIRSAINADYKITARDLRSRFPGKPSDRFVTTSVGWEAARCARSTASKPRLRQNAGGRLGVSVEGVSGVGRPGMACRSEVHCMDALVRLPNAGNPLRRHPRPPRAD